MVDLHLEEVMTLKHNISYEKTWAFRTVLGYIYTNCSKQRCIAIVHRGTPIIFPLRSWEMHSLLSVTVLGVFSFCPIRELGMETTIVPLHSFSTSSSSSGLLFYCCYTVSLVGGVLPCTRTESKVGPQSS